MKTLVAATILAGTVALAACGDGARRDAATSARNVSAPMRDASGKDVGTLTLDEGSGGITVAGRLTGLPPGEHGIHLHTAGKCEGPKFTSAGDHWNPTTKEHGLKNLKGPHSGDLLNLTAGADSSASVQTSSAGGTLRGDNALLDSDGATVVMHAKPDDYKTQPSGSSGDRIACGVVSGR